MERPEAFAEHVLHPATLRTSAWVQATSLQLEVAVRLAAPHAAQLGLNASERDGPTLVSVLGFERPVSGDPNLMVLRGRNAHNRDGKASKSTARPLGLLQALAI